MRQVQAKNMVRNATPAHSFLSLHMQSDAGICNFELDTREFLS